MQVTIHAAKTNLSKLIEAALKGEEVVIARGNHPVVKLVPVEKRPFRYDVLADRLKGPVPDFEPISAEDLDRWEREEDERIALGSS